VQPGAVDIVDFAPSLLGRLGLPVPAEMSGKPFFG
jgi:hypothetical protein